MVSGVDAGGAVRVVWPLTTRATEPRFAPWKPVISRLHPELLICADLSAKIVFILTLKSLYEATYVAKYSSAAFCTSGADFDDQLSFVKL